MNSFLQMVMAERRSDARRAGERLPFRRLAQLAAECPATSSLKQSLLSAGQHGTGIIAEVKQASPSAGLLCRSYDPAARAKTYERAGAAGISVLTEPRHFLGSDNDLRNVRRAVSLPVLRKDFVSDPYQVLETRVLGADVILLIAAGLTDPLLKELYRTALSVGLEIIVEAHARAELERALALDEAIIGVNSRNLDTLKTDLDRARDLAALIPAARLAIAESGIAGRFAIDDLRARGYRGFLIGEALMKSGDAGAALRALRNDR